MDMLELSEKELKGRITLCKDKMKSHGMSGMVLSGDQNIVYYSDFKTPCMWNTFTRPTFMFIPANGTAVLYTQSMFSIVAKEKFTSCYNHKNFDSLLGPSIEDLTSIMEDLGMIKGNIGFEIGHEQRIGFQVDMFLNLKNALSDADFVDASSIIWSQRLIKSEFEIACHRHACEATNYAFDKVYQCIRSGMTEYEIGSMAQKYMLEGGAERPGFVIITSGKGGYERICATGRNRKLEEGDFFWLDIGAVYNGYWSDFCRAGVVGEISEQRHKMQNIVYDVTMKASEMLAPGINVKDVAKACLDGMHKNGINVKFDCGRLGHGIGLNSTEPPSVTLQDDFVLEEGMTINLEPGICTEDGLYNIEENFVVRKNGGECLSGSNRSLHKIL